MSMSVSVVLVRSQPSGFTMSICSVKRFRRSAPRNSGSRWNTVRQFRIVSIVLLTASCVSGGKL